MVEGGDVPLQLGVKSFHWRHESLNEIRIQEVKTNLKELFSFTTGIFITNNRINEKRTCKCMQKPTLFASGIFIT